MIEIPPAGTLVDQKLYNEAMIKISHLTARVAELEALREGWYRSVELLEAAEAERDRLRELADDWQRACVACGERETRLRAALESSERQCKCTPLGLRPWKYCTDCGGRIRDWQPDETTGEQK